MVIVLVFYALNRVNIKIPSPIIGGQYCGDQICQFNENQINCCKDCGCPSNQVCVNNECKIGVTTTTASGITQTTGTPTGTPGESPPPGGSSPGETQTTTTTLFTGCSRYNCEACENSTACYSVGCVWCKVSNRCLIICKG